MQPPANTDTWVGLSPGRLPIDAASAWVVRPECGAVVVFSGTARNHSNGRPDVTLLEYEAYAEQVEPRLVAIADAIRERWSGIGRVALLHRTGVVPIGESSVLVAVSSGHRPAAFEAARFGIDTLKATVPVWKRETWSDGTSWALESQPVTEVDAPS